MSSILCTILEEEIITDRNEVVTTFGAKLRSKMEDKLGGSGADEKKILADAIGVNVSIVYKWLAGRKLEPSNVVKIADFFEEGDDPTLWLHAAGYPVAIRLFPDALEQEWISLQRNFPWLQETVPDLIRLPPKVQLAVIDLIRSLSHPDQDSVQ